jgi:hypothetical protein
MQILTSWPQVLEQLQRVEHAVDFLCCWITDGQPAEMQIGDLHGVISCHRLQAAAAHRQVLNCHVPAMLSTRDAEASDEGEGTKSTQDSVAALHEWLGALSCGVGGRSSPHGPTGVSSAWGG